MVVIRGLVWVLPTDWPLAYCFKCFHLKQLKGVRCVAASFAKINIANYICTVSISKSEQAW